MMKRFFLILSTAFLALPIQAKELYEIKSQALCATAKETLAYLNKGQSYDPAVIHEGKSVPIPLSRIKASLIFICQHQNQLNNPDFIKKHFDLVRWYPNLKQTERLKKQKSLLAHQPAQKILMTKYYVHLAKASHNTTPSTPFALYAIPKDEEHLKLEQADANPNLIRFQYGKQAILKGALNNKSVPVLAYLSRQDIEAALLQGTVVADFGNQQKTFNVHRNNHIAYDKAKAPYQQERYWYFKEVNGIKGYGKDAEHKITVNPEVTFAADLEHFGLGKMLLIKYPNGRGDVITRAGIFADTGGAFQNNQYQIDYLAGSYAGTAQFSQATRHLPDYVDAYFMILKEHHETISP